MVVGVLDPDDGDLFPSRLLGEAGDIGDDSVAVVRVLDDAVLDVDDQERGVT